MTEETFDDFEVEMLFDKDKARTQGSKEFWDRKSKKVVKEFNDLRSILDENKQGKISTQQAKKKVKQLRRMLRNPIYEIQSMDNRPD